MLKPLALCSLLLFAPAMPAFAQDDAASALRLALNEAGRKNWIEALRYAMGASTTGGDIIEWHRLRAGEGTLTEYEGFLAKHPDWPGLEYMRRRGEAAVARSTTPDRILRWFGTREPQTATGSLAFIGALNQTGKADEAEAEARRAWVFLSLTPDEEAALRSLYPALDALNTERITRLLWEGEADEARRLAPQLSESWQLLVRTRLALMERADNVNELVRALPADLVTHPLISHARTDWRIYRDFWPEATELMLESSDSAEKLGRPEAWARRRAQLARRLMRDGENRSAYLIASRHHLTSGGDFAELEFISGFIALRRLDDARTALDHFRKLESRVSTPISVSRAKYWQGRALEALDDPAARDAYAEGARHQTAYYGQLAAEKLGQSLDPALIAPLEAADWRTRPFAQSSLLEAGLLLLSAGDRTLGKRFILQLADGLDQDDRASLAALMLQINEPHIAVLIAKQNVESDAIPSDAYFPVTSLIPADGLAVSRALALAIARRESEFNPEARSPVGARGLMQLMPATAKSMAKELDLPYSAARLTSDPAYNAALGSAYLGKLVAEFGPSVALVASGYNAGPSRPRSWIEEFGDPRSLTVDVVDWVEMIPFNETRAYVMRVAETLTIYRAKLRGSTGPIRITAELKG